MKKKLVLIVAVILILSFVLAGCNLFEVDAERDADQVVATVQHKGLVGEVTKQDFVTYFNNYFPTYNQYFQWDVETAGENFISMLAREKMTLILAVEQLAGNNLNKVKFNAINKANVKDSDTTKGYGEYSAYLLSLLNPDEQKYVKEQTNKMFKDAYDEEIKTQIENDKIKAEEEDDSDDTAKSPRPVKDEEEDTEFKKDSSITQADVDKIKDFFTEYAINEKSTQYEKDAYKKQERSLKNSYRTYEYYLAKQAESRILTRYEETYKDTSDISVKVTANFNKTMAEQKKSYKSADSYKSAVDGDTTLIYHNGRYVKLKSILLQFSDEQKAALEYINSVYGKDTQKDYATSLREALVFGLIAGYNDDLNIPDLVSKDLLGLLVYESNPDYDASKTAGDPAKNFKKDKDGNYEKDANGNYITIKPASEMNYPYIVNPNYDPEDEDSDKWQTTPFLEVIAKIGDEIKKAADEASATYDNEYKNGDAIGKKMYINQKKAEAFEKWIYLVNDDPGMFEGKEYSETPIGTSSSYVTEFTALVRQLLSDNNTAGSVQINTNGSSKVLGNIVKNQVKVDKLDGSLWKKENVSVYTDTVNNISFVINEFGVHIVMLTNVPVDFELNAGHFTVEAPTEEEFDISAFVNYTKAELEEIIKANSFYIFDDGAYVGFDEETGKAITVREQMEKSLRETYDSTVYSEHTKNLFKMYGDKLFDSKDDEEAKEGYKDFKFEITLNKSVYNKTLAPAKKVYKA